MRFGKRLRVLRTNKGLTQTEVASKVGISRRTYVSYEQQGKYPRKRETYGKLAEVLGCDVNDLLVEDSESTPTGEELVNNLSGLTPQTGRYADMATLAAIAGIPLASIPLLGTAPSAFITTMALKMLGDRLSEGSEAERKPRESEAAPITYAKEVLQQYVKEHRQFAATARGLIYSALATHGVAFTPRQSDGDRTTDGPDEVIALHLDDLDEWWLTYEQGDKEQRQDNDETSMDIRASALIARFYDYPPDPRRKVSVVVDNEALFSALVRKRESNSYRGNLSTLLIDRDEISIAFENYIATYEYDADSNTLLHVAGERVV